MGFHFKGLPLFFKLGIRTAIFQSDACHDAKRRRAQHVFPVVFHAEAEAQLALFAGDVRHGNAVTLHRLAHQANAETLVDLFGAGRFLFGFLLGKSSDAQQ